MRLAFRCLGYSLLLLTLATTPLVSAPEAARATPAQGPAQHPPGQAPVPVPPRDVTTVVVSANLSQPAALYNLAPRTKALGGPRPAEVPTPKRIRPRAQAELDAAVLGVPAAAPTTLPTPPLATSFDSLNFESNAANTGFVFIPPDPSGAAGPAHVVSVTNVSLSFHDKASGLVTFEDSLASFFAGLAPLTSTFDPKVVYDQFAGRFVIVTLERTDTAAGGAADTARVMVAVSEDADPNGTWYLTAVDASEVFFNPYILPAGAPADHWADFPGLAVDEEAVYVTANLFTFGTGDFGGVRLWVIAKESGAGGFYDGGTATVSRFAPYAGCGPGVSCFEVTSQPAHIFGTAPTVPINLGTWLVSYNGISDGLGAGLDEYVQVVRVDDPIGPGTTTFTQEFVSVGDIEDPFAAPLPGAEQLGIADTISTNDRHALQAVWRDNHRLYFSTTIKPEPPDPDAGQATAHWFQLDTAPLAGLGLLDQGNVGGEDIHPAGSVHTFFPSISVNADHTLAIGFSASSASMYAGSYYATRDVGDPPGSIGPSSTLRAGLAPYRRTFCSGGNRWGDYSGMSVDPVDQCFWVYNQHALSTGSPTNAPCQPGGSEDGRWGTAFGKFCSAFCGDGVVDDGEDCDDGNAVDGDGCRNDCTVPSCGDSIVDPGETCDPPGQPAGASGNECRGDCTVCGDGVLQAGEACDDGNAVDGDGCHNDCTDPICGDSIVDPGETCDPPGDPAGASGNECRVDCKVCGDGNVDPGEDCDDANIDDFDGCRINCSTPRCGDGIVDVPDETCDPPGQPAGALGRACRADCSVCGDGVVDAGEACDDGNAVNLDACRNNCALPACGDGVLDDGEACDDGNAADGDGCESDCTPTPFCGDGLLNVAGETCDPPGQPAGAGGNTCRANCTVCGDGVVNPGEACDDGNGDDTDGCRNNCTAPVCGDGIIGPGETCDPPGSPGGILGNSCRADCSVCGDGITDPVEECDDGNALNFDACRNNCLSARCGDGITDATEDCDDGNPVNGDGCESDCTETPICGDGSVNGDETCEPPGQPAGALGNACRGDCTVCGDGVVNAGEECDDGNAVNGDGCRNSCLLPSCGDGVVDAPVETCDPPGQPAGNGGNLCRAGCTVCGDGIVNAGEQCDDGNASGLDQCRNDCTTPQCGDGILDAGEACDDGNVIDGDGCESDCTETLSCGDGEINLPGETCDPPGQPAGAAGNACRADCTVCGDGVVDAGEDCDDGNGDGGDGCRNDCTIEVCGDGVVDGPAETCDPPGQPAGTGGNECRADCTVCGDGVVDPGEACDDGNAEPVDGCRNDCTLPLCGDGIVDAGETCDDGNLVDGDGCDGDCTLTLCGDGEINDPGETCDPPGQPAGATGRICRADCTVCGDGVLDPSEECDDGDADNFDACRNNCRLPRCGDGIINAPETCEPPSRPAGASGNLCRMNCTVCGDGVLDPGEQCDDGNALDFDFCRNNCTIPSCGDGVLDPGDEECDDGNTVSGDGCQANCAFTPAGSLTSMVFSRIPGNPEITLSWGPSCLATDTDFAIYEGTFPHFATHVPRTCSTGGSQTATFVPASQSTYYLLVPRNSRAEGSYGYTSLGVQRAASTTPCKPRRLGVCL